MLSACVRRASMSRASTYAFTATAIAASTMSLISDFAGGEVRVTASDLADDPPQDDELMNELADVETDPEPA